MKEKIPEDVSYSDSPALNLSFEISRIFAGKTQVSREMYSRLNLITVRDRSFRIGRNLGLSKRQDIEKAL